MKDLQQSEEELLDNIKRDNIKSLLKFLGLTILVVLCLILMFFSLPLVTDFVHDFYGVK